jgi:fibronectin-binding autotransporter adhesin
MTRKLSFLLLLLAAGALEFTGTARAATSQTWNPGGAGGGSGSWSGHNWNSAAAWVSGNTAVFGAKAGTVTAGTETVGGLTFNIGGYTVSGGTLSLTPSSGSAFVFSTNGGTSTITSAVTSTAGTSFEKTGAGTLAGGTGGGTAAAPNIYTITGGTLNSTTGIFSSILQINYGDTLGTQPSPATVQLTLDAGTLQVTGINADAFASGRTVQVNPAGGSIIDGGGTHTVSGGTAVGNVYQNQILNDAGSTSSLYFSNLSGTTQFLGIISGTGSLTWNGVGTLSLQSANTYTGGTVVNKGTLQLGGTPGYAGVVVASGALGSNTVSLASGAVLNLQGAVLKFNLSDSAGWLQLPSGTVTVTGTNNIRLAISNSLALSTYTIITASGGNLTGTGSFEIDGGSTLTVPAASMITKVDSTFYRLSLFNSSTAEQVVVTAAPANIINEMPMGSSITEGVSSEGATYAGGGYRSQLYQSLVNDGRFTPNFVGSNTVLDNSSTAGYNVLSGANQLHHEGHGGYQTSDILTNLDANSGIGGNDGGFWLAPGNGVNPDYVTLSIGGNDYAADETQTVGPVNRTDAIVTYIETLRPNAHVVLANLFYRQQTGEDVGELQNTYYNPFIPGVVYNHVLAGHHISFVDQYDAVTPGNSLALISSDGIHPLTAGYNVMATTWYNVLAYGAAFWTGAQDNNWSTLTAGNATNFAQNFELTTPRQTALNAATDVYFNSNSAALPTTLGQNISVRGVNFASGATGPVTIGGNSTLTINTGGITVQPGTGAHGILSNVTLGSDQTWGNVSSNPFTVSGPISGAQALTITGSYTIQVPVSATSENTTPETYTGTGSIILSGANTYSGGTTVSSGSLVVSNTGGSGTGTGAVNVASGATLTDNGTISGNLSLGGTAYGSGVFGGTVTVNSGGTFGAPGTIAGVLSVANNGLVTISGGTINANGGVVNNGTIRLERGASLLVGGGDTFTNNGTLDIITGSFSAPAGFTNNGVVLDSSVVVANSASLANGAFALTMNSYTGHGYQLQRSDSLAGADFANIGSLQNGVTGTVLTFTDPNPSATQGFYRVQVDP